MIGALIIGFVGSLHCIGMCGPLSLFAIGNHPMPSKFLQYHGGRILSYGLLGIILGTIGYSIDFFHVQQLATFVLGIALLVLYGIPNFRYRLEKFYYQSKFYQWINHQLGNNLRHTNRWVASGIANGFLPCGLTYVAAASAIALGGVLDGFLFMLLFGLGTVPAMIMVSISGSLATAKFKKLIPGTVSFIAVLSGSLLILRGLLLSSPNFNQLVQTKAAGLITVCGL